MTDNIPEGYCQCGCGQQTKVSAVTSHRYGYVKGIPRRFVAGHYTKRGKSENQRQLESARHRAQWAERTTIPYGYCLCGCGERTKPARIGDSKRGVYQGLPQWYVKGHQRRLDPATHYKVEDRGYGTPCWVWQQTMSNDYGTINDGQGYSIPAHRYYYERSVGAVPEGLHLHHLCEVRRCVNPDHLRPMKRGRHTSIHVRKDRATLTLDKAQEIRRLYAAGGVSQTALGKRFGVSQPVISAIILRKIWN